MVWHHRFCASVQELKELNEIRPTPTDLHNLFFQVLDKDEESPLVADSKAEDAMPSAPDVPAPEKEPVKETSDDVKVIPVEGADVTSEETVVVTPEETVVVTPESPKTEPTNLGDDGFMKVEQADTKR